MNHNNNNPQEMQEDKRMVGLAGWASWLGVIGRLAKIRNKQLCMAVRANHIGDLFVVTKRATCSVMQLGHMALYWLRVPGRFGMHVVSFSYICVTLYAFRLAQRLERKRKEENAPSLASSTSGRALITQSAQALT